MACGCGKHIVNDKEIPTIRNMKQCLDWSLDRAKIIAQMREEDMQVYKTNNTVWGDYYEIEPVNSSRENIIQIVTWR